MRQEDYLLREIEKIGAIFRAISNLLTGKNSKTAIQVLNKFEAAKGMLDEAGFNTDSLLSLKETEIEEYLQKFKGLKGANIELFADVLSEMGFDEDSDSPGKYLEKALFIYNYCSLTDKSFSLERENKISKIKKWFSLT